MDPQDARTPLFHESRQGIDELDSNTAEPDAPAKEVEPDAWFLRKGSETKQKFVSSEQWREALPFDAAGELRLSDTVAFWGTFSDGINAEGVHFELLTVTGCDPKDLKEGEVDPGVVVGSAPDSGIGMCFKNATIDGTATFANAEFKAGADFSGCTFEGALVSFSKAWFRGGQTTFTGCNFNGKRQTVAFIEAKFDSKETKFDNIVIGDNCQFFLMSSGVAVRDIREVPMKLKNTWNFGAAQQVARIFGLPVPKLSKERAEALEQIMNQINDQERRRRRQRQPDKLIPGAVFTSAQVTFRNFTIDSKVKANFDGTDFGPANFDHADLGTASLRGANLSRLKPVELGGINASHVTGLEKAIILNEDEISRESIVPAGKATVTEILEGLAEGADSASAKEHIVRGIVDGATNAGCCCYPNSKNFDGYDVIATSTFGVLNVAGPLIRYALAVQYTDEDLNRHTTQIKFLLAKLAQLQSFQLTQDNSMEFLGLWNALEVMARQLAEPNPTDKTRISGSLRALKATLQLLAPESDDELIRKLDKNMELIGIEGVNFFCCKGLHQTDAALRSFRKLQHFFPDGPPRSFLDAIKRVLSQVIAGPVYFTIVEELSKELAHIEGIVATKAKAAQLVSHVALAGLVGAANFLGRLAYDYSALEDAFRE